MDQRMRTMLCLVQRGQGKMASRLSPEELQAITNSIVSSPQFQQSIERVLNGTSSTSQSNSVANAQRIHHSTPEEEMGSLFNRSRSVRIPATNRPRPCPDSRSRFTANRNRRSDSSTSDSVSRNRFPGSASRSERPPCVLKEVILLANPNERNVVRGPRKTRLMEEGKIFCFQVN